MIAMRRKLRLPAETADVIATVSAQMVEPKAAFSMLQPVNTEPSEHSIAAPLLKREYGEYEFTIATAAFSIRFLSVILDPPKSYIILDSAFKHRLVFITVDIHRDESAAPFCVGHFPEYPAVRAEKAFDRHLGTVRIDRYIH